MILNNFGEIWGSETVEGFVCVNSEGQFGLKIKVQ